MPYIWEQIPFLEARIAENQRRIMQTNDVFLQQGRSLMKMEAAERASNQVYILNWKGLIVCLLMQASEKCSPLRHQIQADAWKLRHLKEGCEVA